MAGLIMFKHHSVESRNRDDESWYFVPQFLMAADAEGFQALADYFAKRAARAREMETEHAKDLKSCDVEDLDDDHEHLEFDLPLLGVKLEGHEFALRIGHTTTHSAQRDRERYGYNEHIEDLRAHYRRLLETIEEIDKFEHEFEREWRERGQV